MRSIKTSSINRNIVECKDAFQDMTLIFFRSINRNIVECKENKNRM